MAAEVVLQASEASLSMHPIGYGVTAFIVLVSLLGITYAFKNYWTRH